MFCDYFPAGVKRASAKKGGRAVAEELTQEYEENAQVVDLHDSEGEEPVKKTPAKKPRAAKNVSQFFLLR